MQRAIATLKIQKSGHPIRAARPLSVPQLQSSFSAAVLFLPITLLYINPAVIKHLKYRQTVYLNDTHVLQTGQNAQTTPRMRV